MYCRKCGELCDECDGCDAMLCPYCDGDHECRDEIDPYPYENESDLYDYPREV